MQKRSNRRLIGLIIVLAGVILLANEFNLGYEINIGYLVGTYWPLFLIGLGISAIMNRNQKVGLLLFLVGVVFQLSELYHWSAWSLLWPTLIIYIGVSVLVGYPLFFRRFGHINQSTDMMNESVYFSELNKTITSQSFQGGSITNMFASSLIDLREVTIQPGGARLDIICALGTVEILVSDRYQIHSEGTPILASWESRFVAGTNTELPMLTIGGNVVLGNVEIKS